MKLFGTQKPAIPKHLQNIFKSKELQENSVCSVLEHTACVERNKIRGRFEGELKRLHRFPVGVTAYFPYDSHLIKTSLDICSLN